MTTKNKKILFFIFSIALILSFCNLKMQPFYMLYGLQINPAEPLGDRGGSHLPEIGLQITLNTFWIVFIAVVIVLLIVAIIVLMHYKKKNRDLYEKDKKQ